MFRRRSILIAITLIFPLCLFSQAPSVRILKLNDVIQLAHENSLEALLAKHRFRQNYWEYRAYKANYLPSLSLNADLVDLTRAITKDAVYENGQWIEKYAETKRLNSSLSFSINQNVPFTGGRIFVNSELGRLDLLTGDPASLMSTPISIGFSQPLFSYNEFKWEKKIEPLKYEEAKKNYIEAMENVNLRAVQYFYDLLAAQMEVTKQEYNLANNDTLYKIAQGRYELGMIDKGELLQMEINQLTSADALTKSRLNLEVKKSNIRTFLGFNDKIDLELSATMDIPNLEIDVDQAMQHARENNPQMLSMERQILQAEQGIARARANARFNADLFAAYGLTQRGKDLREAYLNPQQSQRLTIGVKVPILDWGRRKGMLRMAESSRDVVELSVEQQKIDFDQNIYLQVMQFNMQDDQLILAEKRKSLSQIRYDITKQKFMIGSLDVLKLNDALQSKDETINSYVLAMRTYWNYYYNIRKTTLWDFEKDQPLEEDFNTLLD
ncbi:MAG: TolC family protein [Bacteroidales bacterium]|nr:TolC family protein [Bacteroidales bacterium]